MKKLLAFPTVVFVGLGLLYALLQYGSFLYFGYPSAPGGDLANHYSTLMELQAQGIGSFVTGYPKLFHLFVWMGTAITGISFLKFLLLLIPIVTLGAAYAWSRLADAIAGKWAALIAFFTLLFVSAQPHQTLGDGGFPNFIAAGIFLPFFMLALARAFYGPKQWKTYLIPAGWFLLILLTHHLTSFYAVGVVLFAGILQYHRLPKIWLIGGLVLLLVIFLSPLGESVRELLRNIVYFGGTFPWIHFTSAAGQNALWQVSDYGAGISYFVVVGGILGLLPLSRLARRQNVRAMVSVFVIGLALTLLFGSRISELGFPVRLARDVALPLSVSAACLSVILLQHFRTHIFIWSLIVVEIVWLMLPHLHGTMYRITHYNDWMQYSSATDEAVQYVGSRPTGAVQQTLPAIVKPDSIYTIILQDPLVYPNPDEVLAYNKAHVAGLDYVIYEAPPQEESWPSRSLTDLNFRKVATFEDPLRTVFVYQRSGVLKK